VRLLRHIFIVIAGMLGGLVVGFFIDFNSEGTIHGLPEIFFIIVGAIAGYHIGKQKQPETPPDASVPAAPARPTPSKALGVPAAPVRTTASSSPKPEAPAAIPSLDTVEPAFRPVATAVAKYWRQEAARWWRSSGVRSANCDDEDEFIPHGQGFKIRRRLICQKCAIDRLTKYTTWKTAIQDIRKHFGDDIPQDIVNMAERAAGFPSPQEGVSFAGRITETDTYDCQPTEIKVTGPVLISGPWPQKSERVTILSSSGSVAALVVRYNDNVDRFFYHLGNLDRGDVHVGDVLQSSVS
jgi:hypothetical protein